MVKKFKPKDTLIFLSLFPYFQLFYACIFGIKKHNVLTVTVLTDFLILTSLYCVILLCLKYRKFTLCKIIGSFQNIYWVNFIYVFSICIYLALTNEPVKLYGYVTAIYAINPNFLYALMFIFMELFKLFMDVTLPGKTSKEDEQPKSNVIKSEELQNTINQNLKKTEPPPTEIDTTEAESRTQRISQPQRDIFTLLTVKNYPDYQSRNRLFEAINADLRANGITTKDIKYSTLDKLIDENIRTGSPIRSPFPPKQS